MRRYKYVPSKNSKSLHVIRGYKTREKIYRLIWTFHSYDDDYYPSIPHGHSVENSLKLNVWNGDVYSINDRKNVGKARIKEISKLHRNREFREYAINHIVWFRSRHPERNVYIPEWAMIQKASLHTTELIEDLVIILTVRLNKDLQ